MKEIEEYFSEYVDRQSAINRLRDESRFILDEVDRQMIEKENFVKRFQKKLSLKDVDKTQVKKYLIEVLQSKPKFCTDYWKVDYDISELYLENEICILNFKSPLYVGVSYQTISDLGIKEIDDKQFGKILGELFLGRSTAISSFKTTSQKQYDEVKIEFKFYEKIVYHCSIVFGRM